MSPENFCYWLQGYFEIGKEETLTKEQVEEIKNHLHLVFLKLTPTVEIKPILINTQLWEDIKKSNDNLPIKPYTITC